MTVTLFISVRDSIPYLLAFPKLLFCNFNYCYPTKATYGMKFFKARQSVISVWSILYQSFSSVEKYMP